MLQEIFEAMAKSCECDGCKAKAPASPKQIRELLLDTLFAVKDFRDAEILKCVRKLPGSSFPEVGDLVVYAGLADVAPETEGNPRTIGMLGDILIAVPRKRLPGGFGIYREHSSGFEVATKEEIEAWQAPTDPDANPAAADPSQN